MNGQMVNGATGIPPAHSLLRVFAPFPESAEPDLRRRLSEAAPFVTRRVAQDRIPPH